MTEQQVVDLMESSMAEADWNANADKVKSACSGYPSFWYSAIVLSGISAKTAAKWGGSDEIRITTFE